MIDERPPESVPPGFTRLELSADEMDWLKTYWELRDHSEIFGWAVRMLHDLSQLDKAGWRLTLAKAEVNEQTKTVQYAPDYRQVVMLMRWLGPTKDGWARLPKAEMLETAMRVTPQT